MARHARAAGVRAGVPVPPAVAAARLGRAQQLPQGGHPQRDGHRDDRRGDPVGVSPSRVDADRAVRDRDDRRGDEHAAGSRGRRCWRSCRMPIEAYIRPLPGRTNFALFPWAASSSPARSPASWCLRRNAIPQERRLQVGLLLAGLAGIAAGYAASFRPSIYPVANFWTSSPTFFFIRLGICTAMLPIARGIDHFPCLRAPSQWSQLLLRAGRARPRRHHARPVVAVRLLDPRRDGVRRPRHAAQARPAARAVARRDRGAVRAALPIVKWKDRKMKDVELTGPWRILAPVLK